MEKSYKIVKLVVCIILLCVSLGAALFFAIIPFVNVKTNFNLTSPDTIEVYVDGKFKSLAFKGDAEYSEILNLYDQSFEVKKSELVFGEETIDDIEFLPIGSYSTPKTYLIFNYNTNKTLKEGSTVVVYNKVVIEVQNSSSMTKTSAYIVDKGENSSTKNTNFKYTSYSKQEKLYKYLSDLT